MEYKSIDEKFNDLKKEFPELFIFLFDINGELNNFGKMVMVFVMLHYVIRVNHV